MTARRAQTLVESGLYFTGIVNGLMLQVGPGGGAKSWLLRYRVPGRKLPRDLGLGSFPSVTLAMACEKARAARDMLAEGIDPIEHKRATRSALAARGEIPTFLRCAEEYVADHEDEWKRATHGAQLLAMLRTYAGPYIGKLRPADITATHVKELLQANALWSSRPATAKKVRLGIEHVLNYAFAMGYREGPNPATWAGNLKALLPKKTKVVVQHHRALPYAEVGEFMERLRKVEGMGARALEFAIHTAARSGEVRGATWDEIDLDEAVWSIPGERMKSGKLHRVPLPPAVIQLLRSLPRIEGEALVFPSTRPGRPISDMTMSAVTKRMDVDAVPHGFRSSFRTWSANETKHPREICEVALAHVVGDEVEQSYQRGDLLEKRRKLMSDWSKYISAPSTKKMANVVSIRRATKKAAA